jgi:guanine deaminase
LGMSIRLKAALAVEGDRKPSLPQTGDSRRGLQMRSSGLRPMATRGHYCRRTRCSRPCRENEVVVTVPSPARTARPAGTARTAAAVPPAAPTSVTAVPAPTPTPVPSAAPIPAPATPTMTDVDYLNVAIERASRSVAAGGGPFAALIVHEGLILGLGTNEVSKSLDPTAHAEVVAIRAACRRLHRSNLSDCVLYTSCEPCPLCLAASAWARLSRVVYAAERHEALATGYQDETIYERLGETSAALQIPVLRAFAVNARRPFEAWCRRRDVGR